MTRCWGCGGALALHAEKGDDVHVIFLADGVSSRGSDELLSARKDAARTAADALGVQDIHYADFPDQKLDTVPFLDVVQILEGLMAGIKPDIIYTHHHGDLNIDHKITHQAVLTACRPMPGMSVQAIYGCEVLSSTDVGISDAGRMPLFRNIMLIFLECGARKRRH